MLIDSVIIVLREVIEVAFLASVLLALAYFLRIPAPGLRATTLLGFVGALVFDMLVGTVFDWFGGFGYELATVGVELLVWLTILAILALLMLGPAPSRTRVTTRLMAVAMVLAITREGGEILMYFTSLSGQEDAVSDALTGAVIGAGVGFSAGILFYYLQLAQHPATAVTTGGILLALIGSGMCAQGTMLLVQADLVPAQAPLWDSSGWLPESSPLGQLLYALIGYEATPSPLMAGVWLTGITVSLAVMLGCRRLGARTVPTAESSGSDTRVRS